MPAVWPWHWRCSAGLFSVLRLVRVGGVFFSLFFVLFGKDFQTANYPSYFFVWVGWVEFDWRIELGWVVVLFATK